VQVNTTISRWGEHGKRPQPAAENDALFGSFEARAAVEVVCPPSSAWDLVTNLSRIGEFSPECIEAKWLDGFTGPTEGARFEGTNRMVNDTSGSEFIWIRPCTVVIAERPERFSYVVGDRYDGTPAALWEVDIEPSPTGCKITQHFRHLPDGLSGIRHAADNKPADAVKLVEARVHQLVDGMQATLRRTKRVLESTR
jgi:Polyketide cyclase / dehydrase and lipid transport